MNKVGVGSLEGFIESASLAIQDLRHNGKLRSDQPLLKIDCRDQAAKAPYIFDMVNGVLHRAECSRLPENSKTALYAVWQLPNEFGQGCPVCRPTAQRDPMGKDTVSDIILGFISLIDQFGTVLVERGKEYRSSERGRQITHTFDRLVADLDKKNQVMLKTALGSLDGILKAVQELNRNLENRTDDAADNHAATGAPRKRRKQKKT